MVKEEILEKIDDVLKNITVFYLIIFDLTESVNKDYAGIIKIFKEYGEVHDVKLDSTFILQTTANISLEILSKVANDAGISRFMIAEISKNKIKYKNIFNSDVPKPIGL